MRRDGEQARAIEAMVDLVGIAPGNPIERRPGEHRLHLEDAVRVGVGMGIAGHGQHPRDVIEIEPAQLLRLAVIAKVVLAVRQPQAALVDAADHVGGVPGVLPGSETEKRAGAGTVELGHAAGQRARSVDPVDGLQLPLQGGERRGLRLLFVHAGGVEVAHLPREGIRGVGLAAGIRFEDLAEDLLVALEHLAEGAAPLRSIFGNGRSCKPAAAGEPVEVVAGIHRPIERGEIDAW